MRGRNQWTKPAYCSKRLLRASSSLGHRPEGADGGEALARRAADDEVNVAAPQPEPRRDVVAAERADVLRDAEGARVGKTEEGVDRRGQQIDAEDGLEGGVGGVLEALGEGAGAKRSMIFRDFIGFSFRWRLL